MSPQLALVCLAALASVSSTVLESKDSYSCCENPTVLFDPNCTATFNINNKPFAFFNTVNECVSPCRKLEPGRLTLDRCADIMLVLIYEEELSITEEKKIYLHGELCSGSKRNNMAAGNQGSLALLLLAVGTTGLFMVS